MTRENALQLALGYAWGQEDAAGTRTAQPGNESGCAVFAAAFARGWQEYNIQERWSMVSVRTAYEQWQATHGQSIFRPGDSTADQQQRRSQPITTVTT